MPVCVVAAIGPDRPVDVCRQRRQKYNNRLIGTEHTQTQYNITVIIIQFIIGSNNNNNKSPQ